MAHMWVFFKFQGKALDYWNSNEREKTYFIEYSVCTLGAGVFELFVCVTADGVGLDDRDDGDIVELVIGTTVAVGFDGSDDAKGLVVGLDAVDVFDAVSAVTFDAEALFSDVILNGFGDAFVIHTPLDVKDVIVDGFDVDVFNGMSAVAFDAEALFPDVELNGVGDDIVISTPFDVEDAIVDDFIGNEPDEIGMNSDFDVVDALDFSLVNDIWPDPLGSILISDGASLPAAFFCGKTFRVGGLNILGTAFG